MEAGGVGCRGPDASLGHFVISELRAGPSIPPVHARQTHSPPVLFTPTSSSTHSSSSIPITHSHITQHPKCRSKRRPSTRFRSLTRRYVPRQPLPATPAVAISTRCSIHPAELTPDRLQLSKYPTLNNLEKQTNVPKVYAILGIGAIYFFLIFFNIAGEFLVNVIGFALPGYYSLDALFSASKVDDTQVCVFHRSKCVPQDMANRCCSG